MFLFGGACYYALGGSDDLLAKVPSERAALRWLTDHAMHDEHLSNTSGAWAILTDHKLQKRKTWSLDTDWGKETRIFDTTGDGQNDLVVVLTWPPELSE